MRRVFLRLILLTGLVAALGLVTFRHILVLREIHVRGNGNISREAVIAASGLEPGISMLRLNIGMVKNGIEALGSHAFEGLERHWPDVVELSLHPRTRTAMALCDDGVAVLDADGVVMEIMQQAPDCDLIFLSGIQSRSVVVGAALPTEAKQLALYSEVMNAISGCEAAAYVSEIDLSDTNELRLVLRGGTVAVLGDGKSLPEKIAWMRAAAQDLEQRGASGGTLHITGDAYADFSPMGNRAKF